MVDRFKACRDAALDPGVAAAFGHAGTASAAAWFRTRFIEYSAFQSYAATAGLTIRLAGKLAGRMTHRLTPWQTP